MTQPFNSIGELQLGVDRIATSPTAYVLYENPLALFRGAPGAPRISPWALAARTVAAGDAIRYNDAGPHAGPALNDLHTVRSVVVFCKGTLRVQTQTIRPSAGTTRFAFRRVRGLALDNFLTSEQHSSGSSDVTRAYSFDIPVEPGDAIQLMLRNSGEEMPRVGYFRLRTSGARIWAIGPGSMDVPAEPE